MQRKKADLLLLCASIFSFFMFSLGFLLLAFDDVTKEVGDQPIVVIAAILIWLFAFVGIGTQIALCIRRNNWYKINNIKRKKKSNVRIGLLSFFKNKTAAIADVLMVVSFIALVASIIYTHGTGAICFSFLAAFIFTFSLHCILNGKIYFYVINQDVVLQIIEKEKEKPSDTSKEKERKKNDTD